MATPRQVSQLKSFLACNPNKKLLLLCKELGMEGYSRLSRSDLEKMFINHLQQHPDQFSHMIGLLSGGTPGLHSFCFRFRSSIPIIY
jgi:hypothetical protein